MSCLWPSSPMKTYRLPRPPAACCPQHCSATGPNRARKRSNALELHLYGILAAADSSAQPLRPNIPAVAHAARWWSRASSGRPHRQLRTDRERGKRSLRRRSARKGTGSNLGRKTDERKACLRSPLRPHSGAPSMPHCVVMVMALKRRWLASTIPNVAGKDLPLLLQLQEHGLQPTQPMVGSQIRHLQGLARTSRWLESIPPQHSLPKRPKWSCHSRVAFLHHLGCFCPAGPMGCWLCSTCTTEAKPTLPERSDAIVGKSFKNSAQTLPHAFIMGGCELFCTMGIHRPELEIGTRGCTVGQEQPRRLGAGDLWNAI